MSKKLKTILIVASILVVAAAIFFFTQWQKEKERARLIEIVLNQNELALNDSLRIVSDKLGKLMVTTSTYMSTISDLQTYNSALNDKIDAIEGNVISAINNGLIIQGDSIIMDNDVEKFSDTEYGLKFSNTYQDSDMYQKLSGISKFNLENNVIIPKKTKIFENEIKLSILYGFREVDDKYEVFAKSLSPKVTFTELEGVLILDKFNKTLLEKKKHWAWGPVGGLGYCTPGKFGVFIGAGIMYKIGEF